MRILILAAALIATAPVAAPAFAQDAAASAPVLRSGSMLLSSDGRRIGKITRIVESADGTPLSAAVIYDSRFVYVPVSTISAGEGKTVTTSLSRAEVSKLR